MATRETLSAMDWIKAAFRRLSAGGIAAVRAEVIARDLKVSKGSFYWHFADVPALKSAMLRHWTEMATTRVIEGLDAATADPRAQLHLLVVAATGEDDADYGGETVESALREWARFDDTAAETVRRVDDRRLAHVHDRFRDCGLADDDARATADLFYGAYIGLTVLSLGRPVDRAGNLLRLLDLLCPEAA